MKVVRLSVKHTGRMHVPRDIPDTHLCNKLSQTQGNMAEEGLSQSIEPIGKQTSELEVVELCFNQLPHRVPLYFTKII